MNRSLLVFSLSMLLAAGQVAAQTASFNFSASVQSIAGWTNVYGDPAHGVRTGTSAGITVSSVATANWAGDGNGNCSYDGGGIATAGFFPTGVMGNHWYQYGTTAAAVMIVSQPQLMVTGLHPGSLYTIRLSGSFIFGIPSSFQMDPTFFTVTGVTNYGTQQINANANFTDGAVFNNVIPDSTGTVRIYVNTGNGSNVGSVSGLQVVPGAGPIGNLTAGAGLAQYGSTLALGDSVTGLGPHSFTSNRYQYLNGHQYSFGGSVKDAANHPVMRLYDNGDLAASTTMDRSVSTDAQTGLRYYSKLGILQIGATDRLDTTVSVPDSAGSWPGGGILVNSKETEGNTNILKARLFDSYVQGNTFNLDSTASLGLTILNGQNTLMKTGQFSDDLFTGYALDLEASIDNSIISGNDNIVTKPMSVNNINGFVNKTMDSSRGTLVSGAFNQYGGLWQTVSGVYLTNRTPGGVTFGSGNVDFATLPWTGIQGFSTPNLASYPLLAIGNASSYGTYKTNALTVLYNGRTQINTTGFSAGLTQAQVTPAAALDVVSTNTGVLLPRLTTGQRNAIASGDLVNGLLLYNTDSSVFQFYNGSNWNSVGVGAGGSGSRWLVAGNSVYDSLDNIGIGTSNTQGYKLAVNGPAVFTRVVVKQQSNWPDYVFEPGYKLRPLPEVEEYVHAHHHLPDVVTEDEVKDKGLDVGEQEKTLLKKVEELTLYAIEFDKKVNRLEKEHAQLAARVAKINHGQKSK